MIRINRAAIGASLNADFKSGFLGGSVRVIFDGVLFGMTINIDFTIDFNNIIKSAIAFFEAHVKNLAAKKVRLLHLAERDFDDLEYFETGHFRFKKRDFFDTYDTVLFDSRYMNFDEGIHLIKEQRRRRRLARRQAEEKLGVTVEDKPQLAPDPSADAGQKIPASALPVIPGLQPDFDQGNPPGMPEGEVGFWNIRESVWSKTDT